MPEAVPNSWSPRRYPKVIAALTLVLAGLVAVIALRWRSSAAAADAHPRDTMCVAARIGLSCR